jgi:hypothetical protein
MRVQTGVLEDPTCLAISSSERDGVLLQGGEDAAVEGVDLDGHSAGLPGWGRFSLGRHLSNARSFPQAQSPVSQENVLYRASIEEARP